MGPTSITRYLALWPGTDREEARSRADDDGSGPDGHTPKERKATRWWPVATRPGGGCGDPPIAESANMADSVSGYGDPR